MYDVVIVGAGPAGLFAAYELLENNKKLKVAILDRGFKAENRSCPMNKKGISCVNCNPCGILSGYGGAGTFSDGKLNFIPKLGKSDLFKYMSQSEAYKLIDDTEKIFNKFGMDSKVYPTNMDEAEKIKEKFPNVKINVYEIKNDFFGESVTVAGLVTGRDLVAQLAGKELYGELMLPANMLRHGGDLFLCGMSKEEAEEKLCVSITLCESDGYEFLDKIIGNEW